MTKGMAARAYIGQRGPATGPCRPWGATGPLFFARDFVANLKKKITIRACRPMGGRPGDIFEIFQNGYIFLKFLFFKNVKKKKARTSLCSIRAAGVQRTAQQPGSC